MAEQLLLCHPAWPWAVSLPCAQRGVPPAWCPPQAHELLPGLAASQSVISLGLCTGKTGAGDTGVLPVCRALGAASPLPARCSGRLFALFQKSKPRKLATGCERQDSRSMRSSMKVRAASSSAGFGDSPAVFVVWGPEAGRAAAHGEGQHLRHPAAPRGLGSDPDRGADLGDGGLWDGGSAPEQGTCSPSLLCCCR